MADKTRWYPGAGRAGWTVTDNTTSGNLQSLPDEVLEERDGYLWCRLEESSKLIHLGHGPTPCNSWQGFWHHVGHGLIMQYNALSILCFAWQHRDSFEDNRDG